MEFHKIYEEEIIPIFKSYKQQNEKADKKNRRLKSIGSAILSLGVIILFLLRIYSEAGNNINMAIALSMLASGVFLTLAGGIIMAKPCNELEINRSFLKRKCMSKLLRVFGNINGITIVKSLRLMKFMKRGFSKLLQIDGRMMNSLENIKESSFE